MAPASPERIDVLKRRVRWLERYRRALSIVSAAAIWFVLSRELSAVFGGDWPGVLSSIAGAMFAIAAWWIVEAGFAWVMAFWETEHDRLSRDRGLPRAELLRK